MAALRSSGEAKGRRCKPEREVLTGTLATVPEGGGWGEGARRRPSNESSHAQAVLDA